VRNSVLFPGVHVLPGVEIDDSVVMADVVLERNARVANAILDKYTRVGERAEIGLGDTIDRPELEWLAGLTLVGKDAAIPAGARVGRQVVLGVGAGATDFAGGELQPGTRTPDRLPHEGLV
jgi:glucose-1-phosphate adenylyltransferase